MLRQPGGQHYPSPNLNTAHFYIRTDEKGVFVCVDTKAVAPFPKPVTLAAVKAKLDEAKKSFPEDLDWKVTYDPTTKRDGLVALAASFFRCPDEDS